MMIDMMNDDCKGVEGPLAAIKIPTEAGISTTALSLSVKQTSSILERFWRPTSYKCTTEVPTTKCILNDVSLTIPKGKLTAILGPSGSGKTSLLDILAGRIDERTAQLSGDIFFSGSEPITTACLNQRDYLLPTLTVRENLGYTADLKLPSLSQPERKVITEKIISDLGLTNCANTRIGKGCSGGEIRRASLGAQLLSDPDILFCDEPTTGLDASRAYSIVGILRELTDKGKTVIASVHTPRPEIWAAFDCVVLLSQGGVVYSGSVQDVHKYFASVGFEIPDSANPAEYLVDLVAVDYRSQESKDRSMARIQQLKEHWKTRERTIRSHTSTGDVSLSKTANRSARTEYLWNEIQTLTRRTIKTSIRDPIGVFSTLFLYIVISLITGYIFYQLSEDWQGIRSRQSALFAGAALNNGYLIVMYEVFRLTADIRVFDRERIEGSASVLGFVISRRAGKALIEDMPGCVLSSVIFYFMVGFQVDAARFFIYTVIVLVVNYITLGVALVSVAIDRRFVVSGLIANMCFVVQLITCGNFVQTYQIPVYTRWLKWFSSYFYAFGALCANEFLGPRSSIYGHFYACPYSSDPADPRCKEYTGVFIMHRLGYPSHWIWRSSVILVGFLVVVYALAIVLLHYNHPTASIMQPNSQSLVEASEKDFTDGASQAFGVEIQVRDFSLAKSQRWKTGTHPILQSLDITFYPGQLNIIMGPSGSGKSTLLNAITGRLDSSFRTKNIITGEILINGLPCEPTEMQCICSYVVQSDHSLFPFLTVRETLYHAARLRLPQSTTLKDAYQTAEQILQRMGLHGCADSLLGGDDTYRGISGGEMRRVSIAIQLLDDPQVLVLDEPTSGLDAFASATIFDILGSLASEGRTIILTVHQPRSDLFRYFSNIVLLGYDGHLLYAGCGEEILDHFRLKGYDFPASQNPADCIMDLVSGDLQSHHASSVDTLATSSSESTRSQKPLSPEQLQCLKRNRKPFKTIFPAVLHRAFVGIYRRPYLAGFHLAGPIGIGIVIALFFAPLKHDYAAVQTYIGLMQEFCTIYFVGMIQNTATYPDEWKAFQHEWTDHCHSPESFILQYTLIKLPFEILSSLIYGALVTAVGLTPPGKIFIIAAFNAFAILNCGESLGIILFTAIPHNGLALCVMSLMGFIAYTLGGVMNPTPPAVLGALNHLSPIKYGTANLMEYVLQNVSFDCETTERLEDGRCPITSGEDVLRLYKFDGHPGGNLIALAVCLVVYRVFAYFVVRARVYFM